MFAIKWLPVDHLSEVLTSQRQAEKQQLMVASTIAYDRPRTKVINSRTLEKLIWRAKRICLHFVQWKCWILRAKFPSRSWLLGKLWKEEYQTTCRNERADIENRVTWHLWSWIMKFWKNMHHAQVIWYYVKHDEIPTNCLWGIARDSQTDVHDRFQYSPLVGE